MSTRCAAAGDDDADDDADALVVLVAAAVADDSVPVSDSVTRANERTNETQIVIPNDGLPPASM